VTSELEKAFGPKEPPPDPGPRLTGDELLLMSIRGGSRWRCQDRLKFSLDAMMECWPELGPRSAQGRAQHYRATEALLDEVGELEAPAFIRWASTIVRQEAPVLSVKTCRSLMFLLGRWRARESGPEWYRKPCPKCSTIHPPGTCPEDLEDEDE
jgi:hypothetical protein